MLELTKPDRFFKVYSPKKNSNLDQETIYTEI